MWQNNINPKGNLEEFVDQKYTQISCCVIQPWAIFNSASILLFLVLRLISPVCTSEWCFRDTQGQRGTAWSVALETPPSSSVKLVIFLSSHLPPEAMLWFSFKTMTEPQSSRRRRCTPVGASSPSNKNSGGSTVQTSWCWLSLSKLTRDVS